MDFDISDDDSVSIEFDFRGDSAPTAMDPYRDNVISDRQQTILNDLRIHLCREDLMYLNNHKEVEAIVSLLLNDILKKSPENPYAHAANYLSDPHTAVQVANFKRPDDSRSDEMLKKDVERYATSAAATTLARGSGEVWRGESDDTVVDGHAEMLSEEGETEACADEHDSFCG